MQARLSIIKKVKQDTIQAAMFQTPTLTNHQLNQDRNIKNFSYLACTLDSLNPLVLAWSQPNFTCHHSLSICLTNKHLLSTSLHILLVKEKQTKMVPVATSFYQPFSCCNSFLYDQLAYKCMLGNMTCEPNQLVHQLTTCWLVLFFFEISY